VDIFIWLACGIGVAWLFRLDAKHRSASAATWIVLAWAVIQGSRPVTSWLSGLDQGATPDVYDEGNLAEALVYFGLIVGALLVLVRRRTRWQTAVSGGPWLTALWVFWLASMAWSDYPLITLKRLIKDMGNIVMVLVVLTDQERYQAIRALFTRFAYLCVPLSILLIRYYPSLGRTYSGYDRSELMYIGVSTHKNSLGMLAMVSAVFLLWDLLEERKAVLQGANGRTVAARGATLAMCWYLLLIADSATSLVCALIGSALVLLLATPAGRRALTGPVEIMAVGLIVFGTVFDLESTVVGMLGRDMTLTTRTDIWPILLEHQASPLVGAGFNTFWAGQRLVKLQAEVGNIIQAHNGYVEVYLNGGLIGVGLVGAALLAGYGRLKHRLISGLATERLALVILLVGTAYNFSEAAFHKPSLLWFAIVLAMMMSAGVSRSAAEEQRESPDLAVHASGSLVGQQA
jgi:O-antigen ligase